jgi:hypothetical protein
MSSNVGDGGTVHDDPRARSQVCLTITVKEADVLSVPFDLVIVELDDPTTRTVWELHV